MASGCSNGASALLKHILFKKLHSFICVLSNDSIDGCKRSYNWLVCHNPFGFSILVTSAVALVLLFFTALVISNAISRFMRWLIAKRSSSVVRIASRTLFAYRKARSEIHPPTKHVWFGAQNVDLPVTPLFCSVCQGYIRPLAPGARLQSCACCGIVSHDRCLRHVGDTCKPLSIPTNTPSHFWVAIGTTREDSHQSSTSNPFPENDLGSSGSGRLTSEYFTSEDIGETTSDVCLYCGEPGGSDVLTEPSWCCACCASVVHVHCFCITHPELPSVTESFLKLAANPSTSTTRGGKLNNSSSNPMLAAANNNNNNKGGGMKKSSSKSSLKRSNSNSNNATLPNQPTAAALSLADRTTSEALAEAASLSGTAGVSYEQASERQKKLKTVDVEQLDSCNLGALRFATLPSCCVRLTDPSSSQDLGFQKHHHHRKKHTHNNNNAKEEEDELMASPSKNVGGRKDNKKQKRPSSSTILGSANNEGSSSSSRMKKSWWRRLLEAPPPRWNHYKIIQPLLPGIKPILVFVNLNSGPQFGHALQRAFLRHLHPLQVVSLPKERPEIPLRMFLGVPGLRILAIGGDGTAGWIVSCLEAEMAAAMASSSSKKGKFPTCPPVAILPFGTGNDLARCLGWGGGWRAWASGTPAEDWVARSLEEVAAATPVLIDRWTVQEETRGAAVSLAEVDGDYPPHDDGGGGGLDDDTGDAENEDKDGKSDEKLSRAAKKKAKKAAALKSSTTPKGTSLTMTNYLGLGIDAKVALDFHEMRAAYPQWFRSQLGNKVGYTVLGTKGIVKGEMVGLENEVEIELDGRNIPLPPGTQGLLVMNIKSAYGGVDAWMHGTDTFRTSARPLVPQSMFDGCLELVAVFGAFHIGQLQVGLARAARLDQGRSIRITVKGTMPMHVDGEPFWQKPGTLTVQRHGQCLMLKRMESEPVAKVLRVVSESLDAAEETGTITNAQHVALTRELTSRLQPHL